MYHVYMNDINSPNLIKEKKNYINDFKEIEAFSNRLWNEKQPYKTNIDHTKEKMLILDFFPYPSGVGLHIGHTLGYIATDIYSRFYRLTGKNVLHAMAYDAFGLPAEQFAIENNQHPSIITYKNIANIKSQLKVLGLDHDDDRTFNTTDVNYYKWTQYIFLKLYNSYFDETENKAKPIENLIEKLKGEGLSDDRINEIVKNNRLAYLDEIKVNWCPKLGTVLSNEEVIGGLSERGSYPVYLKPLKQWVLKITKYADRLVENLEDLDWPFGVKEMQRNWIGISKGHNVKFKTNIEVDINIYTTRLETLSGATYLALSKEHPNIAEFFTEKKLNLCKEDSFEGIKSSIQAFNPVTGERIPIFVADYVLPYGTFAVMGVPAHDMRDYNFAKKNNISIVPVIKPDVEFLESYNVSLEEYLKNPKDYGCFDGKNILLNGNSIEQEKEALEKSVCVSKASYTKMRDWIFSRQRYWGEPFPIILDEEGNPYALEDEALPVELPYLEKIRSHIGESDEVLKSLDDCFDWKNVQFIKLPNGRARVIKNDSEAMGLKIYKGTRETNTMPNWAGSCWYYLRYADPQNNDFFLGKEARNYWETPKKIGCVDLYLGGAEHAVLHLLYARFWHMVLYDLGYLNSKEPFQRLFNQGMILGPSYKNSEGRYFDYRDIIKKGNEFFSKSTDELLFENIGKIGKRYKNGVTPEEVCFEYSVDALRLFMMYLGPLEQSKPWDHSAIKGMVRLLDKVYNLEFGALEDNPKILNDFNISLEKITNDIKNLRFNTAISSFIIFINQVEKLKITKDLYKNILIVLNPFAPHLSEYLYSKISVIDSLIVHEKWPSIYNIKYTESSKLLIISINGKKTGEIEVLSKSSYNDLNKIVKNYCNDKNISYSKIIIPEINRKVFFANIVSNVKQSF